MNNKVKEALGSASYLTYHWRHYPSEDMVVIGNKFDK